MTSEITSTLSTILEVYERGVKRWIKLNVTEPVTITAKEHIGWSTSFTTYLIRIETNHYAFSLPYSEVRRRYSDFCWLRKKLAYHHPNKDVPPLPAKKFLHVTKFDGKVIEERRAGLGKFLQRVMRSSVMLSDAALHLFLQSELSIEEIEKRLSEELPVRTVTATLKSPMAQYLARSLSYGSSGSDTDRTPSEGTAPDEELGRSNSSSESDPTDFDFS